jgi:steroid delta-isomerase-like uncharacterized protein
MANEDVKAVAMSYFEELTNKQNVDFADQLFDSSIEFHDPAIFPTGQANGLEEVKNFFSIFFKVFPDVHFEINDLFGEDDRVAIRFTWTGTHRAEFLGIPITERHVSVPGIDIFHIAEGKIVEVRVAFDRFELVQQLKGIDHPL